MRAGEVHDEDAGGAGHRRRVVIVALLLGAIAAAAALGLRAAGAGSAAGGSQHGLAAVTLGPAQIDVGLFPGSRVTVSALALNSSDRPVHIGRVRVDVEQGRRGWASSRPRCRVPQLLLRPQDNDGRGWTVPAARGDRSGALRLRFPRALRMGLLAEERCQGARFAIYLVAE